VDYITLHQYFFQVIDKLYDQQSYDYLSSKAEVIATSNSATTVNNTNTTSSNMTINLKKTNYYPFNANYFCGMMAHFKRALFENRTNANGDKIITKDTMISYNDAITNDDFSQYLIFDAVNKQDFDGKSFYMFLKPNLSSKQINWFKDQINPIFDSKLYYFSYNFMIYNSQYQSVLLYRIEFFYNAYGEINYKKFTLGFQPLVSTNTDLFISLLIINVLYFIGFCIMGFYITRTFVHNIIDWVKNGKNTFEWFTILDLVVISVSFASLVMFLKFYLFIDTQFPIAISNQDSYIYWLNYANMIKDYNRLTGTAILFQMLRLIRYLYTSFPHLGIVFQTISLAKNEMLSFILILVLVLIGFMMMGHMSFGFASNNYRYIQDSIIVVYLMCFGMFSFFDIFNTNSYNPIAPYFILFFMFFFNILLINIFLVILRNNYSEAREKKAKFNESFKLMQQERNIILKNNFVNFLTCKKPDIGGKEATEPSNEQDPEDILPKDKKEDEDGFCQIFIANFEKLDLIKF